METMEKPAQTPSHPVEVWYRVTYSQHYYPPIREMQIQRTDIKNEPVVRKNMNRLIKQGAYAGLTLFLGIAACITVATFAIFTVHSSLMDAFCFIGFVGISYLCRVHSIRQKKVREDFWDNKLSEEQLQKKTTGGRITIALLFLTFLALSVGSFYDLKF